MPSLIMLNKEYNDKLIQLGAELEETEKLKFDLEKQNSILADELSKISKEKGNAILSQKEQKEIISELGVELEDKTKTLHKMKTSYDYVKSKLDSSK